MSLEDVTQITKVSRTALSALENGDLSALPAAIFVRGFIRAYGKTVDLDTAPLIRDYERAIRESETGYSEPRTASPRRAARHQRDEPGPRESGSGRPRTDIIALQMAPNNGHERRGAGFRRGYALLLVVAAGLLVAAWLMVGSRRLPTSTAGTTTPVVPALHDHVDGVSSITDTHEAERSLR